MTVATSPTGAVGRVRAAARWLQEHRRISLALQITLVAATIGFCAWAVRNEWSKAGPMLADANLAWMAVALATVAVYYLVFILGWIRILATWEIKVSYRVALNAEMVSMLAKYLPGGVWTPAARAVALRRAANVTDTPTVLASILLEALLSALSGVIVFVVSLAWVRGVHAPLPLLLIFALLLTTLLHPRIFKPLGNRLLRPFGVPHVEPLPLGTTLGLLLFYCGTWLIGGLGVWFMLAALHATPPLSTVAFLGGVSAVGAIVAVLAVFVPSGLGAREASMYGLLLAITEPAPALGATLVNRLVITVVEVLLFLVGVATWRKVRE